MAFRLSLTMSSFSPVGGFFGLSGADQARLAEDAGPGAEAWLAQTTSKLAQAVHDGPGQPLAERTSIAGRLDDPRRDALAGAAARDRLTIGTRAVGAARLVDRDGRGAGDSGAARGRPAVPAEEDVRDDPDDLAVGGGELGGRQVEGRDPSRVLGQEGRRQDVEGGGRQ